MIMGLLLLALAVGAPYGAWVIYTWASNAMAATTTEAAGDSATMEAQASAAASAIAAGKSLAAVVGNYGTTQGYTGASWATRNATRSSTKQGTSADAQAQTKQGQSIQAGASATAKALGCELAYTVYANWPKGAQGADLWARKLAAKLKLTEADTLTVLAAIFCGVSGMEAWASADGGKTARLWLTAMQHYTTGDYAAFRTTMESHGYRGENEWYEAYVGEHPDLAKLYRWHPFCWQHNITKGTSYTYDGAGNSPSTDFLASEEPSRAMVGA